MSRTRDPNEKKRTQTEDDEPMPKGYVIAHANVTDPEKWAQYAAATKAALDKYGGKPIVRGGRCETTEGTGHARNVVLEFASYEDARSYAHSLEYAEARKLREGAGQIHITVVEGV
jgi:uncharacterized protein (DUF1330 family)